MNERDFLIKGWDYDLWANLKWLPTIQKFKDSVRAEKVMVHIIAPQRFWLDRILANEGSFEVYDATPLDAEWFIRVAEEWKVALESIDPESTFEVTRPDGSRWRHRTFEATRHVLNHGTYHRGHLRGLAQAEGWDDFEDTDWVQWLRETGQSPRIDY